MSKGKGKRKGNNFENEIAKKLSIHWSEGKDNDIFWRSQTSGGRATVHKRKGKLIEKQFGDLTFEKPEGKPLIDKWCFELKTGYTKIVKNKTTDNENKITKSNWCILDLIDSKQKETTFEMFWKQCCDAAFTIKREPILIFRRNNKKACISFRHKEYKKLLKFFGEHKSNILTINNITIINFDDFIEWTKKDFSKYFITTTKFKKLKRSI